MNRLGFVIGGGVALALALVLSSTSHAGGGGSASGTIRIAGGKAPALPAHEVTSDKDCCGKEIANEAVVVDGSGALKNVVVTIEGIPAQPPVDKSTQGKLNNRGCRFEPHVLAVQLGTTLVMTNEDAVLHNVHIYNGDDTVSNQALPGAGATAKKVLKEAAILKVKCDAGHSWMKAFVAVVPHPYFAVTTADGKFSIKGIPAGKYKLKAWQETLGTVEKDIEVKDGADAALDLELAPKS